MTAEELAAAEKLLAEIRSVEMDAAALVSRIGQLPFVPGALSALRKSKEVKCHLADARRAAARPVMAASLPDPEDLH